MNKEIKYKVWDNNKKEIELIDSLFELQRMNLSKEEFENKEFFEYTGYKDKYGVEIFREDITKIPENVFFTDDMFTGVIKFDPESKKYVIFSAISGNVFHLSTYADKIENLGCYKLKKAKI